MFLRSTIVTLAFATAGAANAQLQQPKSLQGTPRHRVATGRAKSPPQPPVLHNPNRPRLIRPIVFQEVPGPIAAPELVQVVPQPVTDDFDVDKGYCSNCNCNGNCGCGRGLRGHIRRKHLYYFGYDPEAWVRPFGDATLDHLEKQVANGVAARMTLYSYDFAAAGPGKAKLNPAGWKQLTKIVDLANRSDFPIVIESTPYRKSAQEPRRQAVLDALRAMGSDIAADRVVVAESVARGLSGEEAVIIYNNLLQQTQVRGNVVDDQFTTDGGDGSSSGGASINSFE